MFLKIKKIIILNNDGLWIFVITLFEQFFTCTFFLNEIKVPAFRAKRFYTFVRVFFLISTHPMSWTVYHCFDFILLTIPLAFSSFNSKLVSCTLPWSSGLLVPGCRVESCRAGQRWTRLPRPHQTVGFWSLCLGLEKDKKRSDMCSTSCLKVQICVAQVVKKSRYV